jgi:prepilin-type N-terminal cleavage/methylation domain-containing protein
MNSGMDNRHDGFTLIEMLLAFTIACMIATFAIHSLTIVLRAFETTRQTEQKLATGPGMHRLSDLLSKAWPAVTINSASGVAQPLFNGRPTTLEFAAISEGFALEGGLVRAKLMMDCLAPQPECHLVLRTSIYRADPDAVIMREPVTLVPNITGLAIRYFSVEQSNRSPEWVDEWFGSEGLPLAVEIRIRFGANNTQETKLLIPLYHARF